MRRLFAILFASIMALAAGAQTTIKVQAPNLVGVNEQFNVTFVINGENAPSDFEWEAGEDFQLVWGPQKGRSSSVSIVNGVTTRTTQTSYTYILMPRKTGHFTLQAAQATVKGKKYTSDAPEIEVVADSSSSSSQSGSSSSSSSSSQDGAAAAGTVSSEDMFMRLTLSKRNLMVGEPVTATLKFYQREVNLAGFENAKFPDFNGFWSQELQAPTNVEFHREKLGEKIYNAAVLRSWTLIPQKAGEIKISPAELVCQVNVRTHRQPTGSIFDDFFQDDYQTIRKRVVTDPLTVRVSALPAGAPASFGGGVGQFRMSAVLTRDSLMTHDAASLKVTVTGTGNVALLEAPKISFPPDFEAYDVKTSDVQGGKVFEYPFIPRSAGEFVIGPVEYSYFDNKASRYVTLTSQPLEIKVARGNNAQASGSGEVQVMSPSGKDVRNIGTDIRYISTARPSLGASGSFFIGTPLFILLMAGLLIAAAAVYFIMRRSAALKADVVGTKNRAANKMARKRLARAETFLKESLYTAFYEELHKTLFGYVSDKLNMDISDMSKENISVRLVEGGVSEALASDYIALLNACEYARYAPSEGGEAMTAEYEKAVKVISEIDESMNRKRRTAGHTGAAAAIAALLALVPAGLDAAEVSPADSLWTAGVQAYEQGDWTGAEAAWTSILDLGLESADLYYNIGNACFRADDLAHAILGYERAVKLNPSHSDARFNLEFARAQLQDKIESVPTFFLSVWMQNLCRVMPSDAWAVIGIVFFALALAMTLLFLLGRSTAARKTGFAVGIVSLLLCVLCISMAASQKSDCQAADSAIVVKAVSSVKSSPSEESAKDLFILHEGTKVRLLDEVGQWRNIELSDGRQGWMRTSDLEVI